MSPSGSGLPEPSSLTEPFWLGLQAVTERLAAARTQQQVHMVILEPALQALGAISGVVLLVEGDTLQVARHLGDDPAVRTVWTDRPLSDHSPATDAARQGRPQFYDHSGALLAAYPQVETQTGGKVAVASAVIPMLLDSGAVGVLVLDFREPHTFTAGEVHFLQTLAAQAAIALDRARLLRQTQAGEARFRRMVEASPLPVAVGARDGSLVMVNDAYLAMLGYSRAEFEAGQIDWQALTPPEGHAQDSAMFEQAFDEGASKPYLKTMLTKQGEARQLRVQLLRHEEDERTLVIGYLQDVTDQLNAQAHAAGLTRQVNAGAAELMLNTQSLDAFVNFTEAASRIDDLDELARLALATLQTLIPGANVVLTERTPTHWKLLHWTDNLDPALLAMAQQQGFALDTPVFAELVRTGEVSFVNGWDQAVQEVPHSGQFQAVAHYPIMLSGQVVAAIGLAVTDQGTLSATQQAIGRSVGRSFTLLYERLLTTQQAQQQRDEAARRSQALEAFAELSRDLVGETDHYTLIQRAQQIILSLLTPGYALYWEDSGDHWQLKSQVGDIGNPELQRLVDQEGLPLDAPALHSTWQTGVPNYQDNYAQGTDTPAEMIRHVQAATAFRVQVSGQPIGMLAIGLFDQRHWTPIDKAVLETAIYNLGLLLERAQNVAALERANQDLKASNEELEAFNYSVSHDLMTPVRHVAGFAHLAEQSLDLPEKARHYLEIVDQGAKRMETLIQAMLLLSRSGRQDLHMGVVDLGLLTAQAQMDAAAQVGGRPIQWRIGTLPLVRGDRVTLQQVMTNLLDNAVKYSQNRNPAVVEVWAEEDQHTWTVCVRDNGAGFDPRYADKLFHIFQRLHRQDEFSGTGVGLAIVRRIIARHGGRVSASGEIGQGATFCFTLPKP